MKKQFRRDLIGPFSPVRLFGGFFLSCRFRAPILHSRTCFPPAFSSFPYASGDVQKTDRDSVWGLTTGGAGALILDVQNSLRRSGALASCLNCEPALLSPY